VKGKKKSNLASTSGPRRSSRRRKKSEAFSTDSSEEENDDPIQSPVKCKKGLEFLSSSSSEDEPEVEEEGTKKRGKRRGNVVESDESEELVQWIDDDGLAAQASGDSDSPLSVTSLSSDASEDNISSRATKSSKSRRKKGKKTLTKNLAKLRDLKKAREATKQTRALVLESTTNGSPLLRVLPSPPSSPLLDDSVVIVDPEEEASDSNRVKNLSPVALGDDLDTSDIRVISQSSTDVCPITKKPLVRAIVNCLCHHIYERAAMKHLIALNRRKGKRETRCPVAGCDQFIEDDWCY